MLETILKFVLPVFAAILGGGVTVIWRILAKHNARAHDKIDAMDEKLDKTEEELLARITELEKSLLEYQTTALTIFRLKDDCLNLHKVDDFQKLLRIIKRLKENDNE